MSYPRQQDFSDGFWGRSTWRSTQASIQEHPTKTLLILL